MNGMIQLVVVADRDRAVLLAMFPAGRANTLTDAQRAHHVTLAFRPSDVEAAQLQTAYAGKVVEIDDLELRANGRICAVFGRLRVNGVMEDEFRHITLGGTVPPKHSAELVQSDVTLRTHGVRIPLELNVVQF